MEIECGLEHVLLEPSGGECHEESLVVVVCHSASVLDLTNHVAHSGPLYSLEKMNVESIIIMDKLNLTSLCSHKFTFILLEEIPDVAVK